MTIVFIGAGNVASNLSKIFAGYGHDILQFISKTLSSSSSIARGFKCNFSDQIKDVESGADMYFICVNDSAIEDVIQEMPLVNGIVVHTSGSTSIDVFKNKFKNFGVFYPCQTFSKFRQVNLNNTSVLIEANNSNSAEILINFSKGISEIVSVTNSEQRLALHVCSIFACNFSNHMYSIAYTLAKKYNLAFESLFPLIEETAQKIQHRSPLASQTGPAKRNDMNTLSKHQKLLSSEPDLLNIYNILSESILKFSH